MLNAYLQKYAESLDEVTYRVRLKNNQDYLDNQAFLDGDYWSVSWFADFWRRFFKAKSKTLGLRLKPGQRVLDCCCGQGYLGDFFIREFSSETIFCDLSQDQLRALRARHSDASQGTASACGADLLRLPFQSESFDYVVGNSFLHHLPDVPGALSQFYRVIKPGGAAILFHEPSTKSTFWESFPLSLLKDTTPDEMGVGFTDLWTFTPDDLARLMRTAGFGEAKVYGAGILSSVLLNWYILLALKLNWRSRLGVYPAYVLRVWLNRIDLYWQGARKKRNSPSLMVIARK